MMIRPPSDLYAAISIAGALLYGGDFIARFAEEIGCEPTETAVRAWAPADFDEVQLIAIDEWIVRRLAERLDEIHDAKRRECSTGRKLVEVKAIATSAALVWTSSTIGPYPPHPQPCWPLPARQLVRRQVPCAPPVLASVWQR
jgi:hypothetical protein